MYPLRGCLELASSRQPRYYGTPFVTKIGAVISAPYYLYWADIRARWPRVH